MFYCGWKGSRVAQSTLCVVFVPVHIHNAQGCKPLSSSALETPGAARGRWLWLTLFPGLLHLLSLEDHPLKKRLEQRASWPGKSPERGSLLRCPVLHRVPKMVFGDCGSPFHHHMGGKKDHPQVWEPPQSTQGGWGWKDMREAMQPKTSTFQDWPVHPSMVLDRCQDKRQLQAQAIAAVT